MHAFAKVTWEGVSFNSHVYCTTMYSKEAERTELLKDSNDDGGEREAVLIDMKGGSGRKMDWKQLPLGVWVLEKLGLCCLFPRRR